MRTPLDPEMLSLAAHEFRTPASVVGGYLRMLERETDPPLTDRQHHMVAEAARSCARLVALVAELSDLGKLDSGTAQLTQTSFDLFDALAQVATGVHEARDRDVILKLTGAGSGAPMRGDLTRLKAAFDAIFRSILRERPGPCTVVADRRLAGEGRERAAVVVVGDEAAVANRYGDASAPFDELRGGLGLALPIARRVIEKHGGHVRSPEGEDGRSVAVVTLPLSE